MSFPIDVDSTIETIKVMQRQEERAYQVTDYLASLPKAALHEYPVDEDCRQVMAKWCHDIADFCNYNRETAAIALNCLDRFMCTRMGLPVLLDRNEYQLAAMTALYTAVKIHEHEAMDPELVSTLSQDAHSSKAVERMESRMLQAIQWRVNPPTTHAFVRHMLDLVPFHLIDESSRETVMELTQFQVDLATCDYEFSKEPASRIAFASLLNAVESITDDGMFISNFETTMAKAMRVQLSSIRDLRIALYESVNGNESMEVTTAPSTDKAADTYASTGDFNASPRAVNA